MKSYSALPEILSAWGMELFPIINFPRYWIRTGKDIQILWDSGVQYQLEATKLYQWFNALLVVKRHDPPPAPA